MLETILSRRSIRKYTDEKVTPEQLATIINAAIHAPSAHNKQPWHFIVVDDKEKLAAMKAGHPYMGMLETADKVILVCGDQERSPEFWPTDCAATTMNILLSAKAVGLGTCWCAVHPVEQLITLMRGICNVPEQYVPFSAIAIGVAEKQPRELERIIDGRVHHNNF